VTISLENLRRGPTANPRTLLEWARRSGVGITLDVGHAVSSRRVHRRKIRVEKIIDLVSERLVEVHLYEAETDRHWAPRNMDILGPIVDKLLTTACRWWTIELEDTRDVLLTKRLLINHFRKAEVSVFGRNEMEVGCVLPV
jgi:sugar phosphate isomerase/epimerase